MTSNQAPDQTEHLSVSPTKHGLQKPRLLNNLPQHRELRLRLGRLQQSRGTVPESKQYLGNADDYLGAVEEHLPNLPETFRTL